MNCPIQITTPTSGTKITVAQLSDSRVYRSSRPMTIGSTRYNSDDVAIAPPVTPPDLADRLRVTAAMSTASLAAVAAPPARRRTPRP